MNTTLPNQPPLSQPASFFRKSLLLFMFMALGNFARVNAQVATNYSFSEMAITPGYTALDPATKTQLVTGSNWHTVVNNVPIGFTFTFNGNPYTTMSVSSNGFITFGGTAPAGNLYKPISGATAYKGAISGYGETTYGLYGGTAAVMSGGVQVNSVSRFVDMSNGAGNYIAKIEYNSFYRVSNSSETVPMSFQIWLYEGSNIIEIHYDTTGTNKFSQNAAAEVGLRGASNADFNNRLWSPLAGSGIGWPALPSTTSPGANNTDVVRTRSLSGIDPGSNRLFRWTPVTCLTPTGLALVLGSATSNGAQFTWNAPSPVPAGYTYEIRTSGLPGTPGAVQSGTAASSPLTVTGLSGSTAYYIYIRSSCGGPYSAWSSGVGFTTSCTAADIPYYQYFNPGDPGHVYSVPGIPGCSSTEQAGTGNVWATATASAPDGFMDELAVYNQSGTSAANTWFYTQGVNLIAGKTYRLSYLYGGSTDFDFLTNKMEVAYGLTPYHTSMVLPLTNHSNIKDSPVESIVNFTAPTSDVYYFGFRAYSDSAQGKLLLDDIQIVEAICIKPVAVTAAQVTYSSALISWTAPSPSPANGYAYYLSTVNTAPNNSTVPTGYTATGTVVANLAGLAGSTQYYLWVRGNCNGGDFSEWSDPVTFTTLSTPPYCTPTSGSGSYFTNLTTTGGYLNINNTTGYSVNGYGDYSSQAVSQSAGGNINFTIATFSSSGSDPVWDGSGINIWVDWNNNGTFTNAEKVYLSNDYVLSAAGSFTVPAGTLAGVYRMRIRMNYADYNPSPCGNIPRGETEDYTLKVVPQPPVLTIDLSSSPQCAGTDSPLVKITSLVTNFDTYAWSPNTGVSGDAINGYTFNSSTSLTYTLTGTQNTGNFSTNTVTFTYNANPKPTPITVIASSTTTCSSGPAVHLTATGGVVSNVPILSQDFNSNVDGWTTTHGSYGGTPANAAWTLRPNNYSPGGTWPSFGVPYISSNDASQFYFTNSDSQGSGSHTIESLVSPAFSLQYNTNASLSFWHYFKVWNNGGAYVEISKTGPSGTAWTTLQSYTTADAGSYNGFTNTIIDLSAYLGETNLAIRFRFASNWGWGWAIDNFEIRGSATSEITWAPLTDLYTDAAATIPYTGTGTNSVYALPTTAIQTYIASASTPLPTICTTNSTPVTINTTIIETGIVAPLAQTVCGVPSDINLTGIVDTVAEWQWATDALFTSPNIIASSASPTLTGLQTGSFSGIRYYRAKITNGSCTAYSDVVSISYLSTTWNGTAWSNSLPDNTKAAIFTGNYTGTSNVSACSVQVVSGNVTFDSGYTLTVTNNVTVTGGSLTFNNNASLVQINDAAINSGNITYKRDTQPMIQYDYTYWSSPVFPQTLVGLSPYTSPDKYFWWDTSLYDWNAVTAPGITVMTPGQGYIIRAPQDFTATPAIFSGQFSGTPNNGIITRPIAVSGSNNLNLIGNPYPSAIDADLFLAAAGPNGSLLNGTIYFWTHNTPINPLQYTQNDYAIYNLSGGVGTGTAGGGSGNNNAPTGDIAAGQAFFAEGLTNGNATFNNSMRLIGSNGLFYRMPGVNSPQTADKHRVWLELKNNQGAYKQTLVGYIENATNDLDRGYDGETLDGGNVIGLYSLLAVHKLSIQGRALPFDVNDLVPLGYKTDIAGNFEINLADYDGLFATQDIYLEDKLLNVIHDLKSGSYSFTTAIGTFEDRFVLRYTDGTALGIDTPVFNENSVVVYNQNNVIHVNTSNMLMDTVKIFDIRGRLIAYKKGINSNVTAFENLNIASGILLVQITSSDNRLVTKKIVY